jgi:glycine/D-amino acid oxidase-like deaminating enzyme
MATSPPRIVVCGAGVIGAAVAYHLARRGARPLLVDRARPGAAASGKGSGFLALDWSAGTPLDALSRASFAMHRELAAQLGAERIGYRPMDALIVAAADDEDLQRYRRLPAPALTAPATGRMVAGMILDGGSRSLDASPFTVSRLPACRL